MIAQECAPPFRLIADAPQDSLCRRAIRRYTLTPAAMPSYLPPMRGKPRYSDPMPPTPKALRPR